VSPERLALALACFSFSFREKQYDLNGEKYNEKMPLLKRPGSTVHNPSSFSKEIDFPLRLREKEATRVPGYVANFRTLDITRLNEQCLTFSFDQPKGHRP
jgi:predicted phage-related endonuclease